MLKSFRIFSVRFGSASSSLASSVGSRMMQMWRSHATETNSGIRSIISVTDHAVKRFKELLKETEKVGIKVGVEKRGCSGLSYALNYADEVSPTDIVVELEGIKFIVDSSAELYVLGTEIDFVQEISSEFVFNNPNAKQTCGCGNSFGV